MAKNKNGNYVAKKKYSYNDRADYHESKYRTFIDKFTSKKGVGYYTDFDALEAAEKQNPKMQYSDGYNHFTMGISRGYKMPDEELKKKSKSFQAGFRAANKAYNKSRNMKF